MSYIDFFCDCEPDIEFTDENSWREHMINVHDWEPQMFDDITKTVEDLD